MKTRRFSQPLIAAVLLAGVAFAADTPPVGVHNFHAINDAVYRGAQPTPEGFKNLAKMGIKVVVDLREPGSRSDAEKRVVEAAGMRYIGIPFRGFGAPTPEQMSRVLSILAAKDGPVFVHCRRGADRTGTVIACYRISHDHWNNQKALAEAKTCGMSWTERAMQHYVLSYGSESAAAPAVVASAAADQ